MTSTDQPTTGGQRDKLDTVRKLLAKAEGASTPEEAEAYTAKAVALMARHGIDDALLAAAGGGPATDEIGKTRIPMSDPYSAGKAQMLSWVAGPLGLRTVLHGARGGKVHAVTLFGHASDRGRAEVLYTSLLLQAVPQLNRVRPRWDETTYFDPPPSVIAAYRRSWLQGFAAVVHRRVKDAQRAAVVEHDGPDVDGVAPVSTSAVVALRDRAAIVDHAYGEAFANLRKARVPQTSGAGWVRGAVAGERADLGGGKLAPASRPAALGGGS